VTNRFNFKCQVQALFRKTGFVDRLLIWSPNYTAQRQRHAWSMCSLYSTEHTSAKAA